MASAGPEDIAARITRHLETLGGWKGATLAHLRQLIHQADPEVEEEWKWAKPTSPGVPVWSHAGILCTGETYQRAVKLTFARGASLHDPKKLFNASLEGGTRRAIDLGEGATVDEAAFVALIRAAVTANLEAEAQRKKPARKSVKTEPPTPRN